MFNFTMEDLAGLALAFVAINKGIDLLLAKVFGTSKEDIKKHGLSIDKLEKENVERKTEIEKINEILTKMNCVSDITLQSLLALINHGIDGNGKDAMKKVRDKLQNEIITKK